MMKKEKDRKIIRDTFLDYQRMYFKQQGDRYASIQMASVATRLDFNLSKNELLEVLDNEVIKKA